MNKPGVRASWKNFISCQMYLVSLKICRLGNLTKLYYYSEQRQEGLIWHCVVNPKPNLINYLDCDVGLLTIGA